jgi:hypothetical protein
MIAAADEEPTGERGTGRRIRGPTELEVTDDANQTILYKRR